MIPSFPSAGMLEQALTSTESWVAMNANHSTPMWPLPTAQLKSGFGSVGLVVLSMSTDPLQAIGVVERQGPPQTCGKEQSEPAVRRMPDRLFAQSNESVSTQVSPTQQACMHGGSQVSVAEYWRQE